MKKDIEKLAKKILEYNPGLNLKDAERLAGLRLFDDDFLKMALENNKPAAKYILDTILKDKIPQIASIKLQHELKSVMKHSVILDVDVTDVEGNRYDIEIQRASSGATPQRARYNSAMVDTNMLNPSESYNNLKESYIIFITEQDVLKAGCPIYYIERVVQETGKSFKDGSHIIYVNGKYKGDDDIGKLIHDLKCVDPDKIHSPVLAEATKYFKTKKEGVQNMCKVFEDARNEAAKEATLKTIIDLYMNGEITKNVALKRTQLSENELEQKIKEKANA